MNTMLQAAAGANNYSFLIMMMNLLIDVIYPLLDPRITIDGKKEG